MATMKTVSARQANRECSDPLLRAERGEQVLITERNNLVAAAQGGGAADSLRCRTPRRRRVTAVFLDDAAAQLTRAEG
jgi:antitoxin (DNA-binding transcriptional repressor) of toxin-antitoxin stability system